MKPHRHGAFSARKGSERKASQPGSVRLADAKRDYERYLALRAPPHRPAMLSKAKIFPSMQSTIIG
jgi:hypothetical protein